MCFIGVLESPWKHFLQLAFIPGHDQACLSCLQPRDQPLSSPWKLTGEVGLRTPAPQEVWGLCSVRLPPWERPVAVH